MRRCRNGLLGGFQFCVGLLAASPAAAAVLQQLPQSTWQGGTSGLPSYVNMYLYVPDQVAALPPVVVAPHHCQGTGPGTFNEMSSLVSRADQSGFIMVFPEATGQNCWDAGSPRSLTHDGGGDTQAIVQMVRYTLEEYTGNAARVYSVGGSSGGIMTEALLGVYPDVFMAGISYMGVPSGCWAEGYNDVVGKPANGTGQWSGPCAGGNVVKSGAEWGDLVRSFFPDYAGHRPRLQHWHGTADTTIRPANLAEDIKQWTNVLALSEAPSGTDTPAPGTTRQYWTNACGYTVYEAFSLAGVGHSVPFDAGAVATYFGLDDVAGPDPEAAACAGAVPGELEPDGLGGATSSGGAAAVPSGGADGVSAGAGGASSGSPIDGTLGTVSPAAGDATGNDATSAATSGMGAVAANGAVPSDPLDPVGASSGTPAASVSDATSSDGCALGLPARAHALATGVLGSVVAALVWFARRRRHAS
jgi:acetylxylan esterase